MRAQRLLPVTLTAALALAVAFCGSAGAAPARSGASACDPQGTWIARGPAIARYLAAVNPTLVRIRVLGGTMQMQLRAGRWVVRSSGLRVAGKISETTSFTEALAIETSGPYTLTGGTLRLGKVRSSLAIRDVKITSGGETLSPPDPAPEVETLAGRTVRYRCAGDTLTFAIPTPGLTATLTFTRP